tara:strand:- start:125 stop:307 length:183 start_codon:yes stop_codon:yes gene_type:complete
MKHSLVCLCGYETPLVEDEEDIDWDLLYAHQEFCKVAQRFRENGYSRYRIHSKVIHGDEE